MWTLDTSVYVRAADSNDPDQATCQALIDVLDAQAAPIIVPRLLLAEVAGALRRLTRDPIRARLAVDTLRSMPQIQLISLDDALIDAAAESPPTTRYVVPTQPMSPSPAVTAVHSSRSIANSASALRHS